MTAGIISGFFLLRVHGNYWWQWVSPSLELLSTDFAFCIQMRFERKMSHFPSRSRFEQTHKQQYNASCCCCYKSRRVGRRPEGDKNFTWDNIMAHVSVSWHFISNKRMNSEHTLESFCVDTSGLICILFFNKKDFFKYFNQQSSIFLPILIIDKLIFFLQVLKKGCCEKSLKLAKPRIKMSCLSSSPHVGFWKLHFWLIGSHNSGFTADPFLVLQAVLEFWPNPLRAVHQSVDYSEQQRILFSPSTSQFLGSFRLKKNRCFFTKMACQIFFHISSPLKHSGLF